MSIRIVRRHEKISAEMTFDFSDDLHGINRLFGMADRISILKNNGKRDVLARLEFFTHVVVKNGMSVAS